MIGHPSMLLIDDSPGECELFRTALKESGVPVILHVASTVEEALHHLAKAEDAVLVPSLVLLDLKLGRQHGLGILRQLKSAGRTQHVPVIVFTTSDDQSDLAACYAGGANGYVTKPGTYTALVQFILDLHAYWLRWNRSLSSMETQC